jgi:hypothetical protein
MVAELKWHQRHIWQRQTCCDRRLMPPATSL